MRKCSELIRTKPAHYFPPAFPQNFPFEIVHQRLRYSLKFPMFFPSIIKTQQDSLIAAITGSAYQRNSHKVPKSKVCSVTGHQQQFRALALGQRPFLDAPFASHLRELETLRRKNESGGYKIPSPGTPAQGKFLNFLRFWQQTLRNLSVSLKLGKAKFRGDFLGWDDR